MSNLLAKHIPKYLIGFYPLSLILGTLISESITVILILLFLFNIFIIRKKYSINDPLIYGPIVLWIYLLFNLYFSNDFDQSLSRSLFFIRYPLLIMAISFFFKEQNYKVNSIFLIWLITMIIVVFDLFFQYFFGFNTLGFKNIYPGRLSGFLNEELKIAHLVIGFFVVSISFFLNKTQNKYFFLLLFLFVIVIVLINERANAIRGLIIFILFFIFIDYLSLKFKAIITFLSIIFVTALILLNSNIKQRFVTEFTELDLNDKSIKNIILVSNYGTHYTAAFEVFKKNKLFGSGIKTFRNECKYVDIKDYYIKNNLKFNTNTDKCSTHPHQYYFEFLSELGLVGLLLFIIYFIYFFYRFIRSYYLTKDLMILSSGLFIFTQLIPFLPTGSFFTSYGSTIFWINISLCICYIKKYE